MKQTATFFSTISQTWNRLPVLVRAILSGFFVSTTGVAIWTADMKLMPIVLAILVMTILLWIYWRYFSGSWGAKISTESRKIRFRSTKLSGMVWRWGLIGALLFVVIVQSSFVITFRFLDVPAGYSSGYSIIETLPRWLAWALIIMSSVVAGICEETGFRGYMQVPLEKRYGPVTGIIVVSVVFTFIHLNKIWAAPVIPNIFFASVLLGILAWQSGSLIPGIIGHSILDVFDYSFWWTNFIPRTIRPTIFKTGVDQHFIFWTLIFVISITFFFWSINKLRKTNRAIASPD